jgi:hypothetical protein
VSLIVFGWKLFGKLVLRVLKVGPQFFYYHYGGQNLGVICFNRWYVVYLKKIKGWTTCHLPLYKKNNWPRHEGLGFQAHACVG